MADAIPDILPPAIEDGLIDYPCSALKGCGEWFNLVFIGVESAEVKRAYDLLAEWVGVLPSVSLYLVPQGFKIRFVVRGHLPDQHWVYHYLFAAAQTEGLRFQVIVRDATPERLHWRKVRSGGPVQVIQCHNLDELKTAWTNGAAPIYDPGRSKHRVFMVFIRSARFTREESLPQILEAMNTSHRIGQTLVVRDIFNIEECTTQSEERHEGARQKTPERAEGEFNLLRSVKTYWMGAVIEVGDGEPFPYRAVVQWRENIRSRFAALLLELEIVPIEIVKQGIDFLAVGDGWRNYLVGDLKVNPENLMSLGYFPVR